MGEGRFFRQTKPCWFWVIAIWLLVAAPASAFRAEEPLGDSAGAPFPIAEAPQQVAETDLAAPEAACDCLLDVQLAYPSTAVRSGTPFPLKSFVTALNCPDPVTYSWDFNYDGATDATTPDATWTYECDPQYYACENYAILKVKSGTTEKQAGATVMVYPNYSGNASASVLSGNAPLTVTFTGTPRPIPDPPAPDPCDCPSGRSHFSIQSFPPDYNVSTVTKTFTTPGRYIWQFWPCVYSSGGLCMATFYEQGSVVVLPMPLKIGKLEFKADSITESGGAFTLSGNANINGQLWFSGNVILRTNPQTGCAMIETSGNVFVKLAHGVNEILLSGQSLAFDVDGAAGTLTPKLDGIRWEASLAGMPLWVTGKPITFQADGIKIEPTLFIGTSYFTLASMKATILYKPGDTKQLQGFEVIEGQLSPGIQFLGMSGIYDPESDIFTGNVSVAFPFMGTWSVSATVRIMPSCSPEGAGLNGFDLSVGLPDPLPIGTTGLGFAGFTLKVDNICRTEKFFIFIGADIGIAEVPGEVFTLSQMGLGYQRPYVLAIEGGTVNVLGYPLGSLSGKVTWKPNFAGVTAKGWANLAGIYQANLTAFLSVSKLSMGGSASGTLQIPDFSCSWYNVPCRTFRGALKSVVTLPYTLRAVEMDMNIWSGAGGWQGSFRGMDSVGPISVALVLQYLNGDLDLLVGTNYENLIGILRTESSSGAFAAERSVTLPSPYDQAIFAVAANAESAPLPSVYLRNPSGNTITPANASSFPGLHYSADIAGKVALFRVDTASAGLWAIGVDNLSDSEVTFEALLPHALPETTFSSVNQSGTQVSIQAAVSPASPNTKVRFYFSDEASGGVGEAISEDLPATSGTVSATWDTAGLYAGAYYLFARTDDGLNPPAVTYFANPIEVGEAALQPPSALSGTRDGSTVNLVWTPSPSPGVKQYTVLYTDAPSVPGYPLQAAAALTGEAVIEGLDGSKEYRFAVEGYDATGTTTPLSAPWYTGAAPPASVRGLKSGDAVSDSVPGGSWRYYSISVPAGTQALSVLTRGATADVDLYLRLGSVPDLGAYDYKSDGAGGDEQIQVTPASSPRPLQAGTWFLGVRGKAAATFSVLAELSGSSCSLACTADAPPAANPGAAVPFQASATPNQCAEAVVYTWSFGDKSPGVAEQNPTHAYPAEGTYTWTMVAASGITGCVRTGTIVISSTPVCTLACSATAPTTSTVGMPASFQATATATNCSGSPSYAWAFGDGQTSTAQNPQHTYTAAGTFAWTLTVTVTGAAPCTRSGSVTVEASCTLTCVASASPTSGTAPLAVAFTASATPVNCAAASPEANVGEGLRTLPPPSRNRPGRPQRAAPTLDKSVLDATTEERCRKAFRPDSPIAAKAAPTSEMVAPEATDVITLTSGVPVNDSVDASDWKYYQITVPVGAMQLSVESTNATEDLDLYVRFGALPDTDTWDYRPYTPSGNEVVLVSPSSSPVPLQAGDWFIGVYGYIAGGSFTITATLGGGGSVTVLQNGVGVPGSVDFLGWEYYSIEVPSGAAELAVTTTGATGDLDLFLRADSLPDITDWDYKADTLSGDETLTVTPASSPKPLSAGTWFIGVHGYSSSGCTYTITATVSGGTPCTLACTATAPASGLVNAPVAFAATATPANCAGAPSFLWTFGDGANSTQQNPGHSYPTGGTFAWSLTVTVDTVTCTKTGSIVISVSPTCTLSCEASAAPSSGQAPLSVSFTATSTPINCTGAVAYSWTFGDGASSALQSSSHIYASAGSYTWTMTASVGAVTCTRTGTITVSAPPSTAYSWAFGDGQTSTLQNPNHTYSAAGTFAWTMTASWNGKTCSQSGTVTASPGGGKPGDCDGNGTVSIGEVQKAINMYLGILAPGCGVDCNGNGAVSIGEVQKVINVYLGLASSC